MKNNYLIIHGSFGSKDGNWFPWLKNELEKKETKLWYLKCLLALEFKILKVGLMF